MRFWALELPELMQSCSLSPDCSTLWVTAVSLSACALLQLQRSFAPPRSCSAPFGKYAVLCLLQDSAKEVVTSAQEYLIFVCLGFFGFL